MELNEYLGGLETIISELTLRVEGLERALLKASGVKAQTDPTRVPVVLTDDKPVTFTAPERVVA